MIAVLTFDVLVLRDVKLAMVIDVTLVTRAVLTL
jgi:hypothetical protein